MKRQPTDSPNEAREARLLEADPHQPETGEAGMATDAILAELFDTDDILARTDEARPDELAELRYVIDRVREVRPQPRREPDWNRMSASIRRACNEEASDTPGWRQAVQRWLETWLRPRYALATACCVAAVVAAVVLSRGDGSQTPDAPSQLPDNELVQVVPADWELDDQDEESWPLLDDELPLLHAMDEDTLDELTTGLAADLSPEQEDPTGAPDDEPGPLDESPDDVLSLELAMEWAELGNERAGLELAEPSELAGLDDPDDIGLNFDDFDDHELDSWLEGLSEEELDEIDAALAG